MSKKGTRALASATLMSLVLTTVLSVGPAVQAAEGKVTRISGLDRYSTAASVATTSWKTSENVVLVNGENYPDAVSASALAKKLDAPILLTTAGSLNANAKDAINKLGAKNVYIIGGNASVSQSVRNELKASYSLVELGGKDRYETNLAVAKQLVTLGVSADNVLVVGGQGFSDALSVAPVAAAKGQILLLANNDVDSMKSLVDFVKANNSKATVVGTKNVISDTIYNTLGAVARVDGGADRFETNLNVLNKYAEDLKADKLYVANASGNGFADALVASALAGKTASPLVLVDSATSGSTTKALTYIKTKATKTTDLNVIGGLGVVSAATETAINEAVNPSPVKPGPSTNGDNTVSEITPVNLNQFTITFNTNVDEDTAELTSNYKVAGTQLTDTNSHVERINPTTVRITLVRAEFDNIKQGDEKTVSVKKGILTDEKTETIDTFDKKIEFKDVTAPTLKSVVVRGNNKIVVEFSEAINMSSLSNVAALIKVDGKTLSNYNTTYSQVKEAATNGTEKWANKVEFYLNSGLNSGEITVKVKDADNGVLVDAAGFAFKEADQTVTVDNVSTKPEIKEITCSDDGEIWITFDRAMDTKTVKNLNYYQINDQDITGAKIEQKANDTQIKLTKVVAYILKDNTNILSLTDDVKDAYGNKINKDTRKSFDKEKDETKPTVLSATIIDNTTLRVQFSEDVKFAYATNIDNYELKDSSDVDLMNKSGVYVEAASGVDQRDKVDTDTYDIKLDKTTKSSTSTYKFDSSKYTLTVSDIIDKATEPNKMDDQTITLDGGKDTSLSVDDIEAFLKSGSSTEVAIYFASEMDSSSISSKASYYYINGDGDSKDLPDDVDITVSTDNKSVVLDFDDANKTINPSATSGEDVVKKIGVKNVKDASGNQVYPGALAIATTSTTGPKLEDNTFKLYMDGDDVKASFQLDTALDTVNADDFKVSGVDADDADIDSDTVTLTFAEGDKADAVLALGSSAQLQIKASSSDPSEDIAGRKVESDSQVVYYNNIAPTTDRDNYSATVTVNGSGSVTEAKVYITMKTPVDTDILGSYKDDFVLTNATKGTNLDVESVRLDTTGTQPTLVFVIKNAATKVEIGNKIDITATSDDADIDLRSEEDGDGNNTEFVPTSDDLKVKTVTVTKEATGTTDTIAPVITVDDATVNLTVGASFTAPTATATDDVDGVVTVVVTGSVDTSKAGTYTLTYTATDAAGNKATKTKTVVVAEASTEVTGTVESVTAAPAPGSTIVAVTLPTGTDATKYTVTVGGTVLTYNETAKKFAGVVAKSYSTVAAAQAETVVAEKAVVQLPVATVVAAVAAPAPGSTIVAVTLEAGADATKYTVTVGGTVLTYNETAKKFGGIVAKSYSTVAAAQAETVVAAK